MFSHSRIPSRLCRLRRSEATCQRQWLRDPNVHEAVLSLFTSNTPDGLGAPAAESVPGKPTPECGDDTEVAVSPDMPLKERALCSFVQVENRDPRVSTC